jgi:glycosyltransferase involved in cell wall biosynthesis
MSAADAGAGTVVVAVATFRRPELLDRLLPSVVEQVTALGPDHSVVVVDNDPDASARSTVASWPDRLVRYVHEPRPGIAAARNRALREAQHADAIAFIDDDEMPSPGWLEALVRTWQQYRCDAVAGPTVSVLEEPVPPWVRASPAFRRPARPTGSVRIGAASGNLLLDLDTLRREGLTFSDDYGLTGGSDTLLTRTLSRRGGVIRWCQEAEARETVPAGRADRDWVLRRNRRVGNAWSRIHLELADSRRERLTTRTSLLARGALRVVRGVVLAGWGLVTRDLGRRAAGECHVAAGLGVLSGASGRVVTEYLRAAS